MRLSLSGFSIAPPSITEEILNFRAEFDFCKA